jgi:CBS domain-containing protein
MKREPRRATAAKRAGRRRSTTATTACSGWERLTAADVMRRPIVAIAESEPLSEVERILDENRISGAPVTDAAGKIVGVVTLRDLVEHYAEDPDARPRRGPGWYEVPTEELYDEEVAAEVVTPEGEETAADAMTAEVHAVPSTAPLRDVAAKMTKHRIHRILVEEDGAFVGVIGTFEIFGALAGTSGRAKRRPARRSAGRARAR